MTETATTAETAKTVTIWDGPAIRDANRGAIRANRSAKKTPPRHQTRLKISARLI